MTQRPKTGGIGTTDRSGTDTHRAIRRAVRSLKAPPRQSSRVQRRSLSINLQKRTAPLSRSPGPKMTPESFVCSCLFVFVFLFIRFLRTRTRSTTSAAPSPLHLCLSVVFFTIEESGTRLTFDLLSLSVTCSRAQIRESVESVKRI